MRSRDAIEALSALAQETRLAAFRALIKAGPEGLPAGVIARRLKVPPATLSFHLAHLVRAGLLHSRRESRQVIYVTNFKGMKDLLGFLTDDCCQGRPEICRDLRAWQSGSEAPAGPA